MFFPLYVAIQVACALTLIVAVSRLAPDAIAARFGARTPARSVGCVFAGVGALLALVWLGQWASYVATGSLAAPGPEAVRLIAAMDTTVIAPTLIAGGVLLFRRQPWGFVVGAMGGTLGGLYAVVLTAARSSASRRDCPAWPSSCRSGSSSRSCSSARSRRSSGTSLRASGSLQPRRGPRGGGGSAWRGSSGQKWRGYSRLSCLLRLG